MTAETLWTPWTPRGRLDGPFRIPACLSRTSSQLHYRESIVRPMRTSNETLRRLERLHVRAWPATETARIDGWLWRWSGGGSQRANSVSTVSFIGNDMSNALDRVEARYHSKDCPSRLHTYDLSQPAGLPELLIARGYGAGETTVTMLATAGPGEAPADVEVADDPPAEWLDVYMEAITESRRAVNRQILRRVPDPRAFFSVRRGGRVISTALCVIDGGHAVAECVATRETDRGQRGADTAMRALMSWAASLGAHTVGLQVVEQNRPALALYRRLGFQPVCTNRFWVKP
jgi:ribosomal protein S18 acetylase RimI-like enzyme